MGAKVKLYNGDCLEVMKGIPAKSIDLILTDPPYGTTTKNKWDSVLPVKKMWEQLKRVIKPNGAILLFGQPPFSSMLIMENKEMFRYEWIWKKTLAQGFLNSKKMPLRATENISVFYDKLPIYNPQMREGKPYNKGIRKGNCTTNYGDFGETVAINKTGDRYPINIIEFSNSNHQEIYHPTQKPVSLLEYLIKTYSKENETVLDFTMGSGSTGVACINTNRDFIGIELDKNYFEIASKRIAEAEKEKEGSLF